MILRGMSGESTGASSGACLGHHLRHHLGHHSVSHMLFMIEGIIIYVSLLNIAFKSYSLI